MDPYPSLPRALLAIAALLSACVGPIEGLYPPQVGEPRTSVYVVGHEWHTGIVIPREDVPDPLWPENNHFPESTYLEVGWGDRDFYQALETTPGLAVRAALWPTSSVLLVTGFSAPPQEQFPDSEIIEVALSLPGFLNLCAYIHSAYARDREGNPVSLGPGVYENSRFYAAKGSYCLFATCNVWTARALRSAGCPITPACALRASNVMDQTRRFGRSLGAD